MTSMNHDDERRSSTEDILAGVRADEEPETRERPVYPGEATAAPEAETATADDGAGATGRAVEGEQPAGGEGTVGEGTVREGNGEERESLLPSGEADELRSRWQEIQTRFVDDPREAVRDADALVADVMRRLAEYFAGRKHGLESQWNRDGEVDTEELRVALQQYRVFFDRLLSN